MHHRRNAWCSAALALTLAAPPVHAAPAITRPTPTRPTAVASVLAVLPLALTGGADDETIRAQLIAHLHSGLARGAFNVLDAAQVASHGECRDRSCMVGLAKATGAGFVLRPAVRVDDRDYVVRLELFAGSDGGLLAESEERCDLCGFAEVGALVEAQAALLRRKLGSLIEGPPRLSVTTSPPGALVLVDDALVGTSPVDRTLLEGEHVVRVMLDGYVGDERKVKLVAGVHETLELPLRREPRIARHRQIGIAGLAIGVPAFAAGVGLIALDHMDDRSRCTGRDVDAEGDCRYRFATKWGGAASLAAGALLIAVGTMLLLRTRDRPPPRRRVHITPTGLGFTGRF